MPQLVSELNLPYLDTVGLERREAVDAIAAARSVHWLARSELGYSVTRLQDVTAILRDQRFHSALSMIEQAPELAGLDRPATAAASPSSPWRATGHARLRRLVAPAFTPASANRLRPTMRRVVGELVDRVVARGECELVADVCDPYPIPIICELLGAPPEDWKLFSAWATDIFRIFNNNLAEDLPLIAQAGEELTDYVSDMITARRADPRDDLLSDLIAIEEEGDRLSTDEMAMLAQAVLMAGTDTTRNQLACSVALFTEHPDQWALLAERPELAGRAVEESMRYLGAVRGTARFAAEDVVYRDVLFPQGTLVATSLAGANRDPGGLRRSRRLRHHPGAQHGADDLRLGHPLLHGCGAGPGRAAGGAAPAGPAPARARPRRRGGVEALDLRHLGPGAAPAPLRALLSTPRLGRRLAAVASATFNGSTSFESREPSLERATAGPRTAGWRSVPHPRAHGNGRVGRRWQNRVGGGPGCAEPPRPWRAAPSGGGSWPP